VLPPEDALDDRSLLGGPGTEVWPVVSRLAWPINAWIWAASVPSSRSRVA
jgi:hypothetical protein